MKTLFIRKAQPVSENEPIESMAMVFESSVAEFPSLDEARHAYEDDAQDIADALQRVLPGGTFHALLIEMLKRKHSMLVIPSERY